MGSFLSNVMRDGSGREERGGGRLVASRLGTGGLRAKRAGLRAKCVPPETDRLVAIDHRAAFSSVGAGDRDRTDDIQLGKLSFYH
jgi:hypothetical protein